VVQTACSAIALVASTSPSAATEKPSASRNRLEFPCSCSAAEVTRFAFFFFSYFISGYTVRNVARCWAFETGESILGTTMDPVLPTNDYFQFFAPDYQLIPPPPVVPIESHNLKAYREQIVEAVVENLRQINGAPSVQMSEVPPDLFFAYNQFDDEDIINEASERKVHSQRYEDKHIVHEAELFDSNMDQDPGPDASLGCGDAGYSLEPAELQIK
jgi:hypothetical protein